MIRFQFIDTTPWKPNLRARRNRFAAALLLATSICLLALGPAHAGLGSQQEQGETSKKDEFRWSLEKGDTLLFRFRKETKVQTDVKGNKQSHTQSQTVQSRWEVTSVSESITKFNVTFDSVDVVLDLHNGRVAVSTSDAASKNSHERTHRKLAAKLKDQLKPFLNQKVIVEVTNGEISKVQLPEKQNEETKSPNLGIRQIIQSSWPVKVQNSDSWTTKKNGKIGQLPIRSETVFKPEKPNKLDPNGTDLKFKFDTTLEFQGGSNPTKWSKPNEKKGDVFDYNPTSDKYPWVTEHKAFGNYCFSQKKGQFLKSETTSFLKTRKAYSDSPIITETRTTTQTTCTAVEK